MVMDFLNNKLVLITYTGTASNANVTVAPLPTKASSVVSGRG
jgi:hypothetical protein